MPLITHPVRAYFSHWAKAGNRHGVHSPFVYHLIAEVLRVPTKASEFAAVEKLRHQLRRRKDCINVTDLGAGSRHLRGDRRRIGSIASSALKPRRQAEQLARIANHFKPATIVELGTSLGITTLYLAQAAPNARIHTVEGCPATAQVALNNFHLLQADNITLHTGPFQDQLPRVLAALDRLDMAYIDGHHAKEPTLQYFNQCLAKAHNDTVFIFDDIHWSQGMEEAWALIKVHAQVTVTIDLFHFGIVFLRREQAKQHFRLRY
ncbi:MAG TPA: class I SAM-dependent methyltransferase [Flavobacteriales bacterium]|nr:class I SAM-dependent methyltransferase [Flavobacteriales bacterium]HRO39238.1 class I SAM-dependent methyltransferase [Flavobacteriales bacterium]HRP81490.1 class I SAM-dependent methyltransferase [Flavobacteriales bacterium]HRQ83817.1 class I SAM-dependent methyltransferase [Flavobacteriales bacterium]